MVGLTKGNYKVVLHRERQQQGLEFKVGRCKHMIRRGSKDKIQRAHQDAMEKYDLTGKHDRRDPDNEESDMLVYNKEDSVREAHEEG